MSSRNVKDTGGRIWACQQDSLATGVAREGQDVSLVCTTPSVEGPVTLAVGWQWEKMADNGLARLITAASPVPRH